MKKSNDKTTYDVYEKLREIRCKENKLMRPVGLSILFITFLFISCGDDDSVSCVTCQSEITPEFVLCNQGGNATVNGEDTGVSYNVYLEDLNAEGVECF